MTLSIDKFGQVLMSRPAGKEAFLMAKAYILDSLKPSEVLSLDFANVKVLAPSWADEFITGLKTNYKNKIEYLNTDNESVSASLKTVLSSPM
ncbi:STAS-like domain-containing protein [uncultured Treponema sp.]|uniref:STAS-like domain-containing protein n=1 Tax=uncultured Treponema sp. TaxID=162155 RepID=UPI0026000485|nr:STAS-like domain-containing protein [uncultured Treponema sp.]